MEDKKIILTERDKEYVKNDHIANEIKKKFEIKNLIIHVFSNEQWSFYKYTVISDMPPFLMMDGCCVVKNDTKEVTIIISKKDTDIYMVHWTNDEAFEVQLKHMPHLIDTLLSRFE